MTGPAAGPGDRLPGDRIELRGLLLVGRIGILPEEIERAQPLEIDLDLHASLERAGATDDLDATIDYGAVCQLVDDLVTSSHHGLLERLAARIADALLAGFAIDAVTVAVRKTRPPVPQALGTSGVRITRQAPTATDASTGTDETPR